MQGCLVECSFLPFSNKILFIGNVDLQSNEIYCFDVKNKNITNVESYGLYEMSFNENGDKSFTKFMDLSFSNSYRIFCGSLVFIYIEKQKDMATTSPINEIEKYHALHDLVIFDSN